MSWIVARTQSNMEMSTSVRLQEGGASVYLPRTMQGRRVLPLFPCYVFVKWMPSWQWVRRTRGVIDVIRGGEHPSIVSDSEIGHLRSMQNAEGWVVLPEKERFEKFRRRQKVRINSGIFSGFDGLYDGIASDEKIAILLSMLGRKIRFVVNEGDAVAA